MEYCRNGIRSINIKYLGKVFTVDETQDIEKKSLKVVTGTTANWNELAKDCVCFANARGGIIFIGIEKTEEFPVASQSIDPELPAKIRKRIAELTINVATYTEVKTALTGGQYIELKVLQSASTIASTTDGRYYIRISDECIPVLPDALDRLYTDKPSYNWETKCLKNVRRIDADTAKLQQFAKEIKDSDRVSEFIKQKSNDELLDYYLMAEGEYLTNLGVLWVGSRSDRAKLLYAPTIQFLKYDETGNRVNKIVWDDFSLNPKDLIEAIWTQIPDWQEGIEVSDGLFRKFIPNYEEEVIRELITNALVHRPYTTRGDIFINLFPDKLEIHNPGLFPIGVTPQNILHKTVRRNEHLAKVFFDLKLMEREGTGYDKMYEVLLINGKQIPEPFEGDDRVMVTIRKRIIRSEIVKFVERVNTEFQLRQKELILLGLVVQNTSISAIELSRILDLKQPNGIRDWLGRLSEFRIIKTRGKTKGMEYYVNPEILRRVNFKGKTNLKMIESHRLKELILQDLSDYPNSQMADIHERIGKEIRVSQIRRQLNQLIADGKVGHTLGKKYRAYFLISQIL